MTDLPPKEMIVMNSPTTAVNAGTYRDIFALTAIPIGNRCRLTDLHTSGLTEAMRRRMGELGLRPGTILTVSQKTAAGGRVIKIGHTRYAIDGQTAKHINVTTVA